MPRRVLSLLRLVGLSSTPSAGSGDTWFDSVMKIIRYHDGSSARPAGTGPSTRMYNRATWR